MHNGNMGLARQMIEAGLWIEGHAQIATQPPTCIPSTMLFEETAHLPFGPIVGRYGPTLIA
jgi:hypothetical protein